MLYKMGITDFPFDVDEYSTFFLLYAAITLWFYINESALVSEDISKFISHHEIYQYLQHLPDFHYMLHNKTYNCNSTPACRPNCNRLSTCFDKLYHITV